MKYFTSDWHINCNHIIELSKRPFRSVDDMNRRLIDGCNQKCKYSDLDSLRKNVVYHLGDFLGYGYSNGDEIKKIKAEVYLSKIFPDFILVEGNHDTNNKVHCHCKGMIVDIGKYETVTVSHYPSMDARCVDLYKPHHIHLCGHVHNAWKYKYDENNDVLNINVGVDVWKYMPVSEKTLECYIDKLCEELHYVHWI